MKNERRKIVYSILGALLLFAVFVRLITHTSSQKPPPSASGYYTGPMKAKSGNSYGTEDGRIVQPPPSAATGTSTAGMDGAGQERAPE